jgi:hypothetical protein
MTLFIVWAMINASVNATKLISPIVHNPVKKVLASESVTASCESPKGYLECQVYQGVITWKDYEKLSKIIKCESNWNENAINHNKNGSFDMGLFQINTIHKQKASDMFNFKKNIDFGIKLYKSQGVTPWVCRKAL